MSDGDFLSALTHPEQEASFKRRRLSNLFNPPEPEEPDVTNEENLDIHEEDVIDEDTVIEEPTLRRSSRKKIRSLLPEQPEVSTRPVRLSAKSSANEIKKYYLDKKVKKVNLSLETIYEEPQVINNEEVVMSSRKFRRVINFTGIAAKNSAKIKKRRVKVKNMKIKKKKKVTLKFLMEKLEEIEDF